MLIAIPDVLTADQVVHARQRLDAASWIDGKVTAGRAVGAGQGQPAARRERSGGAHELGDLILGALQRNALFISAALPLRIFPPLFNRYQGGQSFGNHVDNAIRQVTGTPHRIRTDLSATLFFANPDEYDGGELVVEDTYGVHSVKLPAGHLVLYPSTSLHSVRPVTRGARVASFFWIQSMVRDDGQRTLLFDLDTAIQRVADGHGSPGGRPAHRHLPQPDSPLGRRLTLLTHDVSGRGRWCGRARAALRSAASASSGRRRGAEAGAQPLGDGVGVRLADRRLDFVAPLQEGLDQQELGLGQAASRPRDAGGRRRHRHHRRGQRLLVHDDGAGGQIAEPLVARRHQHRDDADGVDARQLIDDAQQVAQDGFVDPGRAPGDAQHAQADQPLARRLPVPERLEAGEVAVEQQERGDDDDGQEPRAARLAAAAATTRPATAARTSSPIAICSSVSIASARKRLPTPASGNSSATCSGVSMLS